MHCSRHPVYLELFADKAMVHLMAALLDEDVYGEIREPQSRSIADVKTQLTAFGNGSLEGHQLHWAIRDCKSNACVGSLQATRESDGSITIGYRVHSRSQKKGIATEALRLLREELNSRFPDCSLTAHVHPANIASQRVLSKCGFKPRAEWSDVSTILVGANHMLTYVQSHQ